MCDIHDTHVVVASWERLAVSTTSSDVHLVLMSMMLVMHNERRIEH